MRGKLPPMHPPSARSLEGHRTAELGRRVLCLCVMAAAGAAPPLAAQDTTFVVQELHGKSPLAAVVLALPFRIALFPVRLLSHGLSRGLSWMDNAGVISAVADLPARIHPASLRVGGLGEHSGSGAGLGVSFGQDDVSRLGAAVATNATLPGYQLHAAEVRHRIRPSVTASADALLKVDTQDEFYGIGSAAALADRADYRFRRLAGGVGLDWRATGRVQVSARGEWRRETGEGGARNSLIPNIETQFATALPPGFGTAYSYVRPSVVVTWDGLRETPRGVRGAWVTTAYAYNTGDIRFHELDGEAHAYASLGGLRRILALRARLELRRPERGTIPFYRLAVIGGSRDHRAYRANRFRGNDGLLLTAEYRYRIWEDERASTGLDMVLFVDEGVVAPNLFTGLGSDDFRGGYGLGLRLTGSTVIGRVELARGREGARVLVRAGPPF